MRSNMVRTASGPNLPLSTVTSGLSPARGLVLDPELIEAAGDDEIDELIDGLGPVVEARCEEENRRPSLPELQHVPQVDLRERRLSRADDQPALLFQRHRGGAVNQVRHRARGDRPER